MKDEFISFIDSKRKFIETCVNFVAQMNEFWKQKCLQQN